jgi:hypothetical protein
LPVLNIRQGSWLTKTRYVSIILANGGGVQSRLLAGAIVKFARLALEGERTGAGFSAGSAEGAVGGYDFAGFAVEGRLAHSMACVCGGGAGGQKREENEWDMHGEVYHWKVVSEEKSQAR